MTVTRTRDRKIIGTTQNNCKCCCTCYPEFDIKDDKGERMFMLSKDVNCCASMCGGGHKCCGCKCEVPVGFTIKTMAGPRKGSTGEFHRMDDERSRMSSLDSYSLAFPPDAHEEQRVMLLAAALLVDYTHYDGKTPAAAPPTSSTMA